jgi:hypothetical protein
VKIVFDGRTYVVGQAYPWDELPRQVQKDVVVQEEGLELVFGRDPRGLYYELILVPHTEVVRMLEGRFGKERLGRHFQTPSIRRLAEEIEREGLHAPPVEDEGWKRAIALALLGWDMPYFRVATPFEPPWPIEIPALEGNRPGKTKTGNDGNRQAREGLWRMLQRISRGIPGIVGTGRVGGSQFTGGAAGLQTAWTVRPAPPLSAIDAVPIAGFYSFGILWPQVFSAIGLPGTADRVIKSLEKEFGITSQEDLVRGTVPNP